MKPKWVHRRSSPWILLSVVVVVGMVGLVALASSAAASGNFEMSNPLMVLTAIWMVLFGLGIPATLIAAIFWAVALRPAKEPEDRTARVAAENEQRSIDARVKADRDQLRAVARMQRREHRYREAEQKRAIKAEAASERREAKRRRDEDAKARRDAVKREAKLRGEQRAGSVAREKGRRGPVKKRKQLRHDLEAIQVAFCNKRGEVTSWKTYTYLWPYESPPELGAYVIVKANGADALTKIMALGDGGYVGATRIVKRMATPPDLRRRGSNVKFE